MTSTLLSWHAYVELFRKSAFEIPRSGFQNAPGGQAVGRLLGQPRNAATDRPAYSPVLSPLVSTFLRLAQMWAPPGDRSSSAILTPTFQPQKLSRTYEDEGLTGSMREILPVSRRSNREP